ncbi:MAG: hypothetical protein K2J42_10545 [Muribaculaceae bacterium]|nr:hypothetical protein [Muribaculaceae bacterium]
MMVTCKKNSSAPAYFKSVWVCFKALKGTGFWAINFISLSGLLLNLVPFKIFEDQDLDKAARWIVIVLSILILRYLLCMFIEGFSRFANWMRNSYWGSCIQGVEKAQGMLMIPTDADEAKRKQAIIDGIELLNEIAKIVTGRNCGVSVKVPINPKDDPLKWRMETLARDKAHFERDNEVYKAKEHRIYNNTAFNTVISKLKDGDTDYKYINNDRTEDQNYSTTSDGCYPSLTQYVSEIVSPIILPNADRQTHYELRGFLCLDCPLKYPFKNADVTAAIVGTFAKMMHPLLTNA